MSSKPSTGLLELGELFEKQYRIRAVIGGGGHGTVYRARDLLMRRDVAIKVIPLAKNARADHRWRAIAEARVLGCLSHPNVVRVYGCSLSEDGGVYIVMELLHGRTLRQVLRACGTLSVSEALFIGAQVARGVQAAHELKTIHCDLKPDNIFIQSGNVVRVLDFGIAKIGNRKSAGGESLLGTTYYMSPEHLLGFSVGPRSDVFALGATLYEALAGRPPAAIGMASFDRRTIAFNQVHRNPPALNRIRPEVPEFVACSIQRMTAIAPSDRFASMEEVAEVLGRDWKRYAALAAPNRTLRRLWEAGPDPESSSHRKSKSAVEGTTRPGPAGKVVSCTSATTRRWEAPPLCMAALTSESDQSSPTSANASSSASPEDRSRATARAKPLPRRFASLPMLGVPVAVLAAPLLVLHSGSDTHLQGKSPHAARTALADLQSPIVPLLQVARALTPVEPASTSGPPEPVTLLPPAVPSRAAPTLQVQPRAVEVPPAPNVKPGLARAEALETRKPASTVRNAHLSRGTRESLNARTRPLFSAEEIQ